MLQPSLPYQERVHENKAEGDSDTKIKQLKVVVRVEGGADRDQVIVNLESQHEEGTEIKVERADREGELTENTCKGTTVLQGRNYYWLVSTLQISVTSLCKELQCHHEDK